MSAADQGKEAARINVRILDKDYLVACPHEERSALLDSAELLNAKMREIRDNGKIVGADRIAVMAALNLANEVLKLREKDTRNDSALGDRVRGMRERVDAALARNQQLDL
ncbi:MAG: cell division protein ZapA [Gammaproteobacteria bacterium]|nr:cell division protein ZapA [Gammaproteobacteria bacterium]